MLKKPCADPISKLRAIADSADPLKLVTVEAGDLRALVAEHRTMEATRSTDTPVRASTEEVVAAAYERGWREGCETMLEANELPHKDAMNEGCGTFMAEHRAAIAASQG